MKVTINGSPIDDQEPSLREKFAEQAHVSWSRWMEHLFKNGQLLDTGQFTMDADKVKRWKRQMETPYTDLSNTEQESDRLEADHYLELLG